MKLLYLENIFDIISKKYLLTLIPFAIIVVLYFIYIIIHTIKEDKD
jgi:hypothetical protein